MPLRSVLITLIAGNLAGVAVPGLAYTLDDLVTGGGVITVGNVTFSDLRFVLMDAGAADLVELQDILVTGRSSGLDEVTLDFTIDPTLSVFAFEQAVVTNDTIIELIERDDDDRQCRWRSAGTDGESISGRALHDRAAGEFSPPG